VKCCKVTAIVRQDILAVFEKHVYKEKKQCHGLNAALSYMSKQLHILVIHVSLFLHAR
jgi:hypothetical protein